MLPVIENRRSVRDYLDTPVDDKQLQEVLMAAMCSPSAHHKYPWDLVVVKDVQIKERLSKVTPWATHIDKAPVVIAVVGYQKESVDWVEDCSIVAEHIWLEAENQGLSSCWVQIRNNDNAEKEVKEILNIPDDYQVLCLMPLGVPANKLDKHSVDNVDKSKIKQDKY
jgi:nitroreductase